MSNSERYPRAWKIFIEHARNVEGLPEASEGKYRIPHPDRSGNFIGDNDVARLFVRFKDEFYKHVETPEGVYDRIQYIVNNF